MKKRFTRRSRFYQAFQGRSLEGRQARGERISVRQLAIEHVEERQMLASDLVDGALTMEPIAAYNLVVDSNAETPATYAPQAAHLAVKVTNTGSTPLTDIVIRMGDLTNTSTGAGTAGVYPVTTITDPPYPYQGNFSLQQEGGISEATRRIPSLAPGESTVAYVLVSYPALDANGDNVTGAAAETWDDLVFNYDIWVQANEGTTPRLVYDERQITARNEISAMANKIQPNTTSKVPDHYLDAIQAALGWRPTSGVPRIPGAYVSEGIWYDLGNVGAGFDNDGDLVPDRNAWMQPVGDANLYDASAQRLVKCYGLLIVKLNDGTEQLIPFEDQLYFMNLPENNTGAVGLVFYEFLPMQYGASSSLTPYQEVASGYDNEKFNGDFGASGSAVTFTAPNVQFDKSGAPVITLTSPTDAQATFTLSVTNYETTRKFGNVEYGMPPVIGDDIPAGTTYVAGSAAATVLPTGTSVTIRYSTDNGTTWLDSEPAIAASVTDLQWWLDSALDGGETFTVTFKTAVPWNYPVATLDNCGGVSLGGGEYALDDCVSVPLSKGLKIGDTVYFDDGSGGGIVGDGVQNGSEAGLPNIGVSLYADVNGNGILDSNDTLLATTTTDSNGNYEFTDLRDAAYLVAVDRLDADRPLGSIPSTSHVIPITLTTANDMTADFGFSPTLDLEKTLVGNSPVNEGDVVTYALSVTNLVKPLGYTSSTPQTQDLWLSTVSGSSTFTNASDAAGATTGNYASTNVNGATLIASDPIDPTLANQTSPITHVEAIGLLNSDLPFRSGDSLTVDVIRQGTVVGTYTVTLNALNAFSGAVAGSPSTATEGYVSINVTAVTGGWTWTDLTAANTGITITRTQSGSGTDPTIYIDRLGFRVTTVAAEDRSGTLYWGDPTSTFKVGPGTGGELEVLMTGLPGPVENAAFDSVNSQIWFSIGSSILTRTPDGLTVAGASPITASATVTGIDVDPYAGHIYWSESNAIRRANLDGTNVTNIVTGLTAVGSIALDHASGQIFWVQSNANKLIIKRANLNGTGITQLVDSSFGSTKNQNARDLELDENSGRLYFTSDINGDPDIVGVLNTDGTGEAVLYSGFNTIQGIAIDSNNSKVFWGDATGIHGGTYSGTASTLVYPKLTGVVEVEIPEFEFDFVGEFDPNRTLSVVPLSDAYDSTKLEFLGASLTPSSTSVVSPNGTVNWDNIGPINAGVTKTVYVKFRVLEPAGNADGTADNTATVTNALVANGLPANNDTDTVTVAVNPTASIGDFIWQEKGANATYDAGTDLPLPGIKVELLSGTTVVATAYTDATGHYLFEGIAVPDGSSSTYTVRVAPPTGATCIYDATGSYNNESTVTLTNPAGTAGPTDNLSQDFGYTVPNLIYGNVYRDYASDGSLDSTDTGLGTVTVRLMNGSTVVATTTTDANGFYSFGNITPGSYTLEVLTSSLPTVTGTWSQTGETDGTVNNSIPVTVTAGAVIGSKDFGFNLAGTASVGDEVFFDLDRDHVKDAGEEGIPNVSVLLYRDVNRDGIIDPTVDTLVATDVTDANGNYGFTNLPAGSYIAVVDTNDPDFPNDVTGVTANPQGFSLVDGQNLTTVDFGYFPGNQGSINGNVWHDRDMDAAIDGSETSLAGITVTLYADLNGDGTFVPYATAVTDANGNYTFSNLPYGSFRVVVDTADSDLPESSGRTFDATTPSQYTTTLSPTNPDDTFNFGFAGKPSIGDYVFYDANRNGTQDAYEAGIPNVTVKLYEDANGDGIADGPAVATVVTANGTGTDPAGFYQFTNLDPGKYLVEVDTTTLPYPMINSADPDRDGVPWLSPADTTGGLPASDSKDTGIDLSYSNYTGADFGYVPRGVVGDFVWLDQNADGVQDPGELGIAGVTVTATFGSTTYTTTTDNDGYYAFANLPAGTWTISISGSPLTGKTATYDADGGTDNSTSVTIDSSGNVTNTFDSLDVDFGLKLTGPYSLSGSVCTNDARTSGVCDDVDNFLDDATDGDAGATDETELAGQTVYLYQKVGTSFILVATTTTDVNGDYAFVGLPNGDYKVVLNATSVELQNSQLTTTAADTPATALTNNGSSVIQEVTISGANVENVDFAYVPLVSYDFGDLPDRYVATLLGNDGARHIIPAGSNLILGSFRDAEPNGQSDLDASGDDQTSATVLNDDEDGVVPLNILSWTNGANGGSVQVTIPSGETGYLVAWIDFNQDDSLIDIGEMVISQSVTGTGSAQTITFDIPAGTITAGTDYTWFARFRLFPTAPAYPLFSYTGVATDGEVEDYEFNRYQAASLGDRVWLDQDADGVQDASEWGIPGITVTLRDSSNNVVATQVTSDGTQDVDNDGAIDPVGYYRFPLLSTGAYTVDVTVPSKYSLTYDADSGTTSPDGVAAANVASLGTHLNTLDFGLKAPTLADISGTVYYDATDDNTIGSGDTGLGAVCVQLWTDPNGDGDPSDGVQVRDVMTETDGTYRFDDLPAYRYVVIAKDPVGYTSEDDVDGSPTDSRVRVDLGATNSTGNDLLDDGPALMSIGGTVYNDDGTGPSNDDLFSGLDTPIAGVTLKLYFDADGDGLIGPTDPYVDSTVTDSNGDYLFPNLPAGKYLIEEVDPTGFGSDNDTQGPATDNLIAVTLTTTNSTGNDFLDDEIPPTTVSGHLYIDTNGDGNQDTGEPDLANVDVEITDANGNTQTVTTDANGDWTATVPPGFTTADVDENDTDYPTGYTQTEGTDPTTVTAVAGTDTSAGNDGYQPPNATTVSGHLYIDTNGDGNQDTGEPDLANVDVEITDANGNTQTVTTDASGNWSATVPPGSTTADVDENDPQYPTGYTQTEGTDPTTVTAVAGTNTSAGNDGYYQSGTVSGHLYIDTNGDGNQDTGEPNLANVDVEITDANGNTQTVTTDANGNWSATVPPGSTTADVDETDPQYPTGYTQTEGTDPTTVTAVAGTNTSAGNDGYYQSGTVSGHLYIDTNGDGNQDGGEPDLANVDVEITDANGNTQTVTTDANGNWSATVPPGSTTADVDETDPQYPTGYTQTEGTDPTTVTAVAGTTTSAGNDGYYQSGTVSGHLYIDTNGDGNQDGGEPDLANVDVEITDANGNTQTVTTDANGNWSATVPPGSTTADVDENDPQYPTGYTQTEGTDPTTVTAVAGTNTSAGNDGYQPPNVTTVSGHLYIDTNGDGNQDAGEPDLANVDVEITDANGNTQTVTTDANGDWTAVVPPGSTTADVDENDPQYPTGYTQTEGTDPTTVTAVANTDTNAGIDGYYQSGTVGGHLYIDTNGDGNQDAGEPDLANVDVEITDVNGNTQTVTTDANGNWSATVPPGSTTADVDENDPQYPTGYTQTEGTDPTTVTAVAGTTTSAGNDGYYQSGTVSGHLYIDTNGDGNQDTGEPNLANVDVEITDANGNTQTVTTDANGNWSATVPPGSTTADVDETDPQYPTGYTQTEGTDPTTVTAVAGTTTSAGNDGYYQSGTVSGHLYIDTNGDGNQDAGEPDLANVDVEITDANGNTQTVTTDASGNWSATVPPGSTTADVDETDPQYPTGYAQTEGTDPTTVTAVAGTNVSAGNDGYTPGIPPVAVNDSRSNLRPGPALIRIAANDSDPDTNTTLDLSCIDLDPATSGQQTTYTVSGQGTWRLGTGGQVTFFPQAGFTQDPTPIGYTICNTGGLTSNIATITLDYAPVASNDSSFNNPVGTPVTLNVVLNDVKGDVVDPTTVKILGTANPGDPLVVPGQGTWSVNPTTGAITFTPQSGFTGDPSPIRYTVRDYDGNLSNVATVTVTYVKPCTGFPLTLAIDDLSTPGIDHIIVDGSPVGTSTALGTSTQLDAAPETQGQVSFSGSTARFSFVKVQALSKPFLTSTSPDIQITASFKSSAAGQIVVRATDGCYGVTSGSPQQLVSPIGGTTAGKVVFKETVDWQNRQFGQSGSTTKTNNYTSPAPGAFSGQPSSSFTPAQPWVSLTKQVNVSHSRANQLTTLNAGGKILPLVAAAVSQSFVGLHASPWTTQELVGLPSWAQPSVARQPVSTAQVAQQTLFADSGLAASGTSVVSGSAAIDEVMQGWSGRFGEDLDSGL